MGTLELAPAAGAGIGKVLAAQLLALPDFMPAMVNAVMGGLKAKRQWWGKDENGKSQYLEGEDSKIQLQAFALLMAHMEGEPIKRIIHQHLGAGGPADPLAALRESPALRDAARRMLDKADFSPRQAEPVEAEIS